MNSFLLLRFLDIVSGGMLVYFIVGLAVIIVLFLILREIACWYWKINERIVLLQEQNILMKEQNKLLTKLVSGCNTVEKAKGTSTPIVNPVKNQPTQVNEAISEPEAEVQSKMADIPQELLDKMSLAQIAKVEKLIEEMGETDLIVYHDHTIKLISKDRWNGLVNSGESDKFEIVYRRQ